MLLIPLLHIIGIGDKEGAADSITRWISRGFDLLGLPLNLPMVLAAFVVLASIQALLLFGQSVLGTSLVQDYIRSLRNDLFRGMAMAPPSHLSKRRASDLLHLTAHDINQVGAGTQQAFNLVRDLLISLVFVGLSFTISVPLSLLALLSGLILVVLLRPLNRTSQQTGQRLRNRMEALTADVSDLLSGLKLVKAFGRECTAIERFRERNDETWSEQIGFVKARSGTQVFSQIGSAITMALFVFVASKGLMIPASEYLVMILLFSRLLPRVSALQQSWQFICHSQSSLDAIQNALTELSAHQEAPLKFSEPPLQLRKKITFSEVTFRYAPGLEPAVRSLKFEIPAGQITAVLGPSGSGKTTMADLIAGLLSPETGSISVDGRPLDRFLVPRWRRSIGYVPQESYLFHESIRSNLLWARPEASEDELWDALRLAGAERFVSRLDRGLDTVVRDRGGRLSGGERQRVALARALLIRPTLLLLDEATSEVDRKSQERILDSVAGLKGKMTVVIIAHHAPVEGIADQVLVMEQGSVRVSKLVH